MFTLSHYDCCCIRLHYPPTPWAVERVRTNSDFYNRISKSKFPAFSNQSLDFLHFQLKVQISCIFQLKVQISCIFSSKSRFLAFVSSRSRFLAFFISKSRFLTFSAPSPDFQIEIQIFSFSIQNLNFQIKVQTSSSILDFELWHLVSALTFGYKFSRGRRQRR